MVQYDSELLYRFAGKMYAWAVVVVVFWCLVGGVGGGIVGKQLAAGGPKGAEAGVIIGVLVGLAFGFMIGQSIAFWIRLKAQLVLCQVAIEENTRSLRESGVVVRNAEGAGSGRREAHVAPDSGEPSSAGRSADVVRIADVDYSLVHGSGDVFCIGCRKATCREGMYHDPFTDTYYHRECMPK